MPNSPDWLPVVLILLQGLIGLVMLLFGMVLRRMGMDTKDLGVKLGLLQSQVHQTEINIRHEIHELDIKHAKDLVTKIDFDKLGGRVQQNELTLAQLKTRDELRWLEGSRSTKQGNTGT